MQASVFTVNGIKYGTEARDNNGYNLTTFEEGKDAIVVGLENTSYSGELVIPENVNYNGKTLLVKYIGGDAFRDCRALTSVSIPNSITIIGGGAFYGCRSLETIALPNSVKVIEDNAFFNCDKLATVELGNRIESIGSYAFCNCYSLKELTLPTSLITIADHGLSQCGLKSITIPRSVKNIGYYVLFCDHSLSSITVEDQNTKYDSRNNCNAIICKDNNELIQGCLNSTIPEDVISIGRGAFDDCMPMEIKLPSTLVSIGENAFAGPGGGYSPETLFIPKSVKEIGDGAFENWTNLTSITVEEGNTAFDTRDGCNALIRTSTNELIRGCYNSFIPTTVTAIGVGAFSSIGYYDDSPDFASITIPNSVTSIGGWAFRYCHKLTSVQLPSSLKSIGQEAFCECELLTSITIPASVEQIRRAAFSGCYSLSTVISLSENPIEIGDKHPIEEIGRYPVFGDYKSATLFVPVGCKSKYEATEGWNKFKNIVEMTPYDVLDDNIVAAHFLQPDETGKVEIPEKVEIDGIEYTVTEIAEDAFKGNTELTEVTIPGTVTTIGSGAFGGCTNLKAIYVLSPTPANLAATASSRAQHKVASTTVSQFEGIDLETCVLYVPYGSEQAYREAEGWKDFKHIVGVYGETDPSGINDVRSDIRTDIYDLQGRKIKGQVAKKGVYVVDGKKVVTPGTPGT